MLIKCGRCGTKREYKGKKLKLLGKYPQFTTCSKCRTSIKIEEVKTRKKNGKASNK